MRGSFLSFSADPRITDRGYGTGTTRTFRRVSPWPGRPTLGNPAGVVSPANAPRFTCLTPGTSGQSCLPPPCASINDPGCLFGPAPAGGFPYTPGNTTFAINWGLDQNMKTPYAHVFNFSIGRQLTSRSSLQIAYVGTI